MAKEQTRIDSLWFVVWTNLESNRANLGWLGQGHGDNLSWMVSPAIQVLVIDMCIDNYRYTAAIVLSVESQESQVGMYR